jgi:hypothetical protein
LLLIAAHFYLELMPLIFQHRIFQSHIILLCKSIDKLVENKRELHNQHAAEKTQ